MVSDETEVSLCVHRGQEDVGLAWDSIDVLAVSSSKSPLHWRVVSPNTSHLSHLPGGSPFTADPLQACSARTSERPGKQSIRKEGRGEPACHVLVGVTGELLGFGFIFLVSEAHQPLGLLPATSI